MTLQKTPSQRLILEALESRLAPAGLVTVSVAGGVLTVTGDPGDNNIEITAIAPYVWELKDPNGTGTQFRLGTQEPRDTLLVQVPQSLRVTLNAGNDHLKLNGTEINGSLTIASNDGDDVVDLSAAINGALSVDTGNGTDDVFLSGLYTNTISIKTGAGDDDVSMNGGFYGKGATVDLGTGSNRYGLITSSSIGLFGALNVTAAGGVTNTQQYSLEGPDITVGGVVNLRTLAGKTNVFLGNQAEDFVHLLSDLRITTASGDDFVVLSRAVIVQGQLAFNGGAGNNALLNATEDGSANTASTLSRLTLGSLNYTGGTGIDSLRLDLDRLNISGAVTFNGGSGNNSAFLRAANDGFVAGSLSYIGGVQADRLEISGTRFRIAGMVTMAGSSGFNGTYITPTNGVIGGLNVTGGTGDDTVYLGHADSSSTVMLLITGKVTTNVSTGASDVRLNDVVVYDNFVHTSAAASGNDYLQINDAYVQGTTTLNLTGNAQGLVQINDSLLYSALTIGMGGGNDVVAFDTVPDGSTQISSFYGAVTVNLGAGDDLWIAGSTQTEGFLGNNFYAAVKIDGSSGLNDEAIFGNSSNGFITLTPASLNPKLTGFEFAS